MVQRDELLGKFEQQHGLANDEHLDELGWWKYFMGVESSRITTGKIVFDRVAGDGHCGEYEDVSGVVAGNILLRRKPAERIDPRSGDGIQEKFNDHFRNVVGHRHEYYRRASGDINRWPDI